MKKTDGVGIYCQKVGHAISFLYIHHYQPCSRKEKLKPSINEQIHME